MLNYVKQCIVPVGVTTDLKSKQKGETNDCVENYCEACDRISYVLSYFLILLLYRFRLTERLTDCSESN